MYLRKELILKRTIRFMAFCFLISSNLLYALSSMVVFGNNKETRSYYNPEEDEEIEVNRNGSINLPCTSVDSEEFKYILSSIGENMMIDKIINSEKFKKRFYNVSNLKLEELTRLLEKSAKTIITQELNKTKKEIKVRVLLYNQDNDVRGYSFSPNSNWETRTIGINIKNHNMTDSADLVETIFHESYDEKKHNNNEWSAIRFGRYARGLWDMVVRVNNFTYLENSSNFTNININDPRIEDATKETKKIYKKVRTLGYSAGIFNEAKIMGRILDDEKAEIFCKALPSQCIPGSSPKQYKFIHYEVFFEDKKGGHIGFHKDGQVRPDDEANIEKYMYVIKEGLDDEILREAIDSVVKEGIRDYNALIHNCQYFITHDVIPKYDEICEHRRIIAEIRIMSGDRPGGIRNELGAGLGVGLNVESKAEFDDRSTGFDSRRWNPGVDRFSGDVGNGFDNVFGDFGVGLNNGPNNLNGRLRGIGFGNGFGEFGNGLGARPKAEFDDWPDGIGNGLGNEVGGFGGIGGLGNGPGGIRGELGAGLGAMFDAGLGQGGRPRGEHREVGVNFGGGGWNPGANRFGGGGFGNGAAGFGGF